jgi:hypothetical protein
MRALNQRILIGWTFVVLAFMIFGVGNIMTNVYGEHLDLSNPGPPPALIYHPDVPEDFND